jgi:uncharacterized protein YukE
MLLDPEGRLIMGNTPLSFANMRSSSNDERTTLGRDDISETFLSSSHSAPWARNVARLCQRVRDVQTLIQEDLREIEEPLTTLGTVASTLSQEHVTQWEAAKIAYSQTLQECTQALEHVLSPFTETQETLERRRDLADSAPSRAEAVSR